MQDKVLELIGLGRKRYAEVVGELPQSLILCKKHREEALGAFQRGIGVKVQIVQGRKAMCLVCQYAPVLTHTTPLDGGQVDQQDVPMQ